MKFPRVPDAREREENLYKRLRSRPQIAGCHVTTRAAGAVLSVCGGESHHGVALTSDEMRDLRAFYGITPEQHPLLQAGATREMFRFAERDGLRVVAVLAKQLAPGSDPVVLVRELLSEAGHDVGPLEDGESDHG